MFNQLINSCINNDRRAQREFFYRYSKQLMAVAMRYSVDQPSAQDIVQESFIRIYKHLVNQKDTEPKLLLAWMRKITAREAIRWLKKNKRYTAGNELENQLIATGTTGEDVVNEKDLHQLLLQLPVGYRTVFNLYVIEGYAHKEIAEMLGITEGTSRSQLTRGRNQLRVWLNKQMADEHRR